MANNDASIILRVLDKASAPLRQIGRSFQTMSKASRAALQQSAKVAAGVGAGLAATSAAGIAYAGKQSGEIEDALGEVASVGVDNLDLLRETARQFTNQWSKTNAPEFIRAAYDIKSGISSLSDEGVAEFATLAGLTAKATKAATGEMTSFFATAYGIFREQFKGLSDIEFGKVLSGGIAGAVKEFKTTGPAMQQAVENLGATATKALVPMQEQLAVLGMLQQTMQGSEAGTKYKSLLQNIAKAGGELGLPFLNAQKQVKGLPEVLDLLRKKYGDTLDAVEAQQIKEAFGSEEAVAVINLLYDKTGELRTATKSMSDQMAKGAAVAQEMAGKMNNSLNPESARAGQRLANLAAVIGEALTPALLPLMRAFGDAAVRMQAWVKEHPALTRAIAFVALGLGGLVAVLGTVVAAMTALNVAVLANPITWIVAGIVAALAGLAVAGVWVVANWDKVKVWWSAFWDNFGNATLVTLGLITGPLGWLASAAGLILNNWEDLKAFFTGLWDDVLGAWDSGTWVDAGVALVKGLWDGMGSLLGQVASWFGDKVRAMVDWLPDWMQERLGFGPAAAGQAGGGGSGAPDTPATPAAASAVNPRQALALPQNSRVDGKVVIDVNAPPGTRIRSAEQSGDAAIDLAAGLTIGMAY